MEIKKKKKKNNDNNKYIEQISQTETILPQHVQKAVGFSILGTHHAKFVHWIWG